MGLQDAQGRVGTDLMAVAEKAKFVNINSSSELNFNLEPFDLANIFNFEEDLTAEVTLPNPSSCVGSVISIEKLGAVGTLNVSADVSTPPSWTDAALTAVGDHVIAYSNGFDWIKLAQVAT
jgi:hypothetical protein